MAQIGRPPEPVPAAIADAIIEWLYEGKSLLSFCRQPGMPKRQTIDDWKAKDPDFASRFARARLASGQVLQELAQEVADDRSRDYIDKDGKVVFDAEHVQRSKLRVDQMNRRAACYNPAECGTSTKVALGGDASAPPIQIEAAGPSVPPLGDLLTGIVKLGELAHELLVAPEAANDGADVGGSNGSGSSNGNGNGNGNGKHQ